MKEFDLNGVIVDNDDAWVYEWFEMEHTCPSQLKNFLTDAAGEDVQININSGGGSLYSGVNMYDQLRAYDGNVEIHVSGIAASAASIVAMGGKCLMSPGAMLMIHNASQQDYGNKRAKSKAAADLDVHDKGIANVYAQKTGLEVGELMKMMDKETYLDAQAAVEKGFVDGIITETSAVPKMAAAIGSGPIPQDVINELRQLKIKNAKEPDGVPVSQLKKRLDLLRR